LVELGCLGWILTDEMRTQFLDSSPDATGIGREVEGPKRAAFAITYMAIICFYSDNGGIENFHRFTARPFVGSFMQGQINLICKNSFYFHGIAD
jgi:hypothetical protein